MLSGKGARRHADIIKYSTVFMKPCQSILELRQQFLIYDVVTGDITKFQECSDTPDYVCWNMKLDSRKIDLERYSVCVQLIYA